MSGTEDDEEWSGVQEAPASKRKKPVGSKRKRKPNQRVETEEQKEARLFDDQLKRTAVKNGVMSREAGAGDSRSASEVPLALRLDACNVIKKNSAKKIKFLFQLPSIFVPKGDDPVEIGSLRGLHSKHPEMLLKLPNEVVLKLRGCVIYPKKCSYINLAKVGYDVKVEDTFDSVIVWGEPEIVGSAESATRQPIPARFAAAAADAQSLESSQEELFSSQSQDSQNSQENDDDDGDEEEEAEVSKPERQSARAAAQPRKSYKDPEEDEDEDEEDEDSDDSEDQSEGEKIVEPRSVPKKRKATVPVGGDEDSDEEEFPAEEIDLTAAAGPRSPRRPRRSSVSSKPKYYEISDDEAGEDDGESDSVDENGTRRSTSATERKPAKAKPAAATKPKPKPAPAAKKPSKNDTAAAAATGRPSAGKRKGRTDESEDEELGFTFEKKPKQNTLDTFFTKKS